MSLTFPPLGEAVTGDGRPTAQQPCRLCFLGLVHVRLLQSRPSHISLPGPLRLQLSAGTLLIEVSTR